jgi:hypothetical protein
VNLKAHGGAVEVGPGQLSLASADQPPSAAAPIPAKVLLKVAAAAMGDPCAAVEGVAEPGAEVVVDGRPVEVDPSGHFRAAIDGKGRREVKVVMRDVSGRTSEEKLSCAAKPESIDHLKIHWKE